jgi:MoaA/NifB/PqqE/SkfB family radical SAM enzyme
MLCDLDQDREARAFLTKFNHKALKRRIPLIGGVELTSRCNLNCVHCYVNNDTGKKCNNLPELSTLQWMNLIDQFAEAGCLYLLFTGGETLLRSDFSEIYTYACKKGLLVTVFTNGTLVSERIIDTFNAYPPHCLEISLYGATVSTYEKITGVAGSFEKCMQGIYQIKEHGFNLKLKTMLLTLNSHEIEDMQAFASDMGVSFRYDASISPRLDGDLSPLKYRVSANVVARKETLDRKKIKEYRDLLERMNNLTPSDNLYVCGAGMTMFHVDSSGILRPCFMVPDEKYDIMKNSFNDMWYGSSFIDFRKPGEMPKSCVACDKKSLCGYCPGFFKLETGNEQSPASFLCEIGEHRKQMSLKFLSEEKK